MTEKGVHETHDGPLLTCKEVARIFRVHPKTVLRWAQRGKIEKLRTPGGHPRFRASDVRRLLDER